MHITMVKKRFANGETCRKCVQAEELLRNRGLWDWIDEVVWADDRIPRPRHAARSPLGVSLAPFFLVEDGENAPVVYESVLKLVQERLAPARAREDGPDAVDLETAARELSVRHPSEILRWGIERALT